MPVPRVADPDTAPDTTQKFHKTIIKFNNLNICVLKKLHFFNIRPTGIGTCTGNQQILNKEKKIVNKTKQSEF